MLIIPSGQSWILWSSVWVHLQPNTHWDVSCLECPAGMYDLWLFDVITACRPTCYQTRQVYVNCYWWVNDCIIVKGADHPESLILWSCVLCILTVFDLVYYVSWLSLIFHICSVQERHKIQVDYLIDCTYNDVTQRLFIIAGDHR